MALVGSGSGESVFGSQHPRHAVKGIPKPPLGDVQASAGSIAVFSNGITIGEPAYASSKAKRPLPGAGEATRELVHNGTANGAQLTGRTELANGGEAPSENGEHGARDDGVTSETETKAADGEGVGEEAVVPNGAAACGEDGGEEEVGCNGSGEYDKLVESAIGYLDEKVCEVVRARFRGRERERKGGEDGLTCVGV